MTRNGKTYCDGRHLYCDTDDAEDVPEAPYFRNCAWCGIELHLCLRCRDRKYTCDRCFGEKQSLGVDEARRRAAARERERLRGRVRRRRILRPSTSAYLFRPEDFLGERT